MTGPPRLYRNARLLDPESGTDQRGDLLVEGDRIAALGPEIGVQIGSDVETVDLAGMCLAPGLVDMRVQLREPGAEHLARVDRGVLALRRVREHVAGPEHVAVSVHRPRRRGVARLRRVRVVGKPVGVGGEPRHRHRPRAFSAASRRG